MGRSGHYDKHRLGTSVIQTSSRGFFLQNRIEHLGKRSPVAGLWIAGRLSGGQAAGLGKPLMQGKPLAWSRLRIALGWLNRGRWVRVEMPPRPNNWWKSGANRYTKCAMGKSSALCSRAHFSQAAWRSADTHRHSHTLEVVEGLAGAGEKAAR
ncbi:hypothetical protein CONLIGDRAFT_331990 [Coniochaeta ligniaria NRRL 30616]|uniref:Uncharacterized protein n=1 Tax=Coniochaeta ligniaria NRRL 30616 TaxID=1408157 RepID=A0A1J7IPX3_9PEZI|nr:hypothetical protein CONLIGDRAFT_331990 [Coniochaeta ligniaria NRRL 30616]